MTVSAPDPAAVALTSDEAREARTLMRFTGSGRRSGVPFEQLALGEHVFREGLCVNQSYWWDSRRGARELGLQLPSTRR